jgi:hypothetical protein
MKDLIVKKPIEGKIESKQSRITKAIDLNVLSNLQLINSALEIYVETFGSKSQFKEFTTKLGLNSLDSVFS